MLKSAELLSGALDSFREKCIEGIEANVEKIDEHVQRSLMLVRQLYACAACPTNLLVWFKPAGVISITGSIGAAEFLLVLQSELQS